MRSTRRRSTRQGTVRLAIAAGALAGVTALSACTASGSDTGDDSGSDAAPPAGASPSASASQSDGPSAGPGTPSSPGAPPAPPVPPGPGVQSLTGTIELDGACTVLRVGNDRWALLGQGTRALANGDTITARGKVTNAIPRTCDTPKALIVQQVRPA